MMKWGAAFTPLHCDNEKKVKVSAAFDLHAEAA
jgi:hypothetical protein